MKSILYVILFSLPIFNLPVLILPVLILPVFSVAQQAGSNTCQHSFNPNRVQSTYDLQNTSREGVESFFLHPENITKYQGQQGIVTLADEYFNGDLYKTFRTVSESLKKTHFKKLQWKRFEGSTYTWHKMPEWLYENNKLIDDYFNLNGYMLFARRYFHHDLELAFRNVSARFGLEVIKELGWKKFQGKADDAVFIQKLFVTKKQRDEFSKQIGYKLYATMYFKGDLEKAFKNTSAVLDSEVFYNLHWKKVHGKVPSFYNLRQIVMNKGMVRDIYLNLTGYIWLADKEFDGDLDKAFKNTSAVLSKKEFSWLNWKKLYGTTAQLQALIADFNANYPQHYIGVENQKKVALKIYKGDTYVVYRNVSALRESLFGFSKEKIDLFYQLNWSRK